MTMNSTPLTREQQWQSVRNHRGEADVAAQYLLRNAGWRHTSQTPTFIWMWQKVILGVTYCVDRETALRIQSALDNEWLD